MSILWAICGAKQAPSIKRVPMDEETQEAVNNAFLTQEVSFREGIERPFDENWMSDEDEIATTLIPVEVTVFSDISQSNSTSIEPIDAENLDEILGLAVKVVNGRQERILVQVFGKAQSLTRDWWVSLVYKSGTFNRLESSGFRLGEKLVCIVEDNLIKFRSLYSLSRVIDTSVIFSVATKTEVYSFVSDHSHLFDISNVEEFMAATSRNAKKYIASVVRSGVLMNHTVQTLKDATTGTGLHIKILNNRIVMPQGSRELTEFIRFLNDGRYVGPVSGQAYITNSRRPAS